MFYGLNNYIKKILPKRLFYRSLIIVATPIILLQIIITVVFFDSLWIKANKGMTRSLVSEVKTLYEIYQTDQTSKEEILDIYNKNFDFVVRFKENEIFPTIIPERWYSPMDRSLRRELKSAFPGSYWFDTTSYKETVYLKIKYKNGFLQIFFPKDKIAPSSVRIFALWITLPGLLLIFIAIVFLKNQTRPIVNLAKAAEKFGKGEYIKEFRPSGAKKMSEDIEEMERMLNEYLEFSRHQKNEETEIVNLNDIIKVILTKYENKKISSEVENNLTINIRPNSIKRCLANLIDNGLAYGKKVEIIAKKTLNHIVIYVDDDGPGIPENERLNVMKPFYRIDKSRGQNKSGVGLGLSITNDIIRSHGGNIALEKSTLNGLRVKISLPL